MTPARPRLPVRGPNLIGFGTLFAREVRRYLKEAPETVLAHAFTTLVYLAIFVLALGPDRSTPEGRAVVEFLLPGLVMFNALFRACETTAFSMTFQKIERTIGDVVSAPLSPAEITGAFVLAGTVSGLLTGAVVMAAVMVVNPLPAHDPLLALGFAAAGSLMLALFGMLVGQWAEKWDHLAGAFVFVLMPFAFLSGVFAPVATLPGPVAFAMGWNPLHHAIDGFRGAMVGDPVHPPALSAAVLAGTIAILWALSLRLVARGWRLKG
jgi:ABC-2 type transport system permease protein